MLGCVKAGMSHYARLREKRPEAFKVLKEQEAHMKTFVSSYHYIKGMKKLPESQEDPMIDDFIEAELKSLDSKYEDYFSGNAVKPKPHFHPAITGSGDNIDFVSQKFSFMKKQNNNEVKPYLLRDLEVDLIEQDKIDSKQIDLFDIGGCGCFVDFG